MPTLHWRGKDAVLNHHLEVPYRLLKCDSALSAGAPGTGNLIVEGDNLQALKALLPYYKGQVKCIYIDPPYNTGNEGWIYNDNVNSPEIKAWLGQVVGKEAEDLNRHDKWLCMMWPRLKLLREFLSPDGVIFVSIDDSEVARLRMVLDDLFGSGCFVASVVWRSSDNSNNDAKQFSTDHNHLLIFSRLPEWRPQKTIQDDSKRSHFKNPDNDPRGPWFDGNPLNSPKPRANLTFNLISPTGFVIEPPPNGWRWSRETIQEKIETGEIRFRADGKGIRRRTYLADMEALPPSTLWIDLEETGHNRQAKSELKAIFSELQASHLFSTPKPVRFIERILELSTESDSLIMDSFAGSGTTAHAVMKLNAEDGGDRKFILVEMDPTIARTVTAERVKRVAEGYTNAKGEAVAGLGGGFRYCALGAALFDGEGQLSAELSREALAHHLYFTEFGEPLPQPVALEGTLIGAFGDRALHLLFTPGQASLLDRSVLKALPPYQGERVVFADGCTVPDSALAAANVRFRQIPYDVRG